MKTQYYKFNFEELEVIEANINCNKFRYIGFMDPEEFYKAFKNKEILSVRDLKQDKVTNVIVKF